MRLFSATAKTAQNIKCNPISIVLLVRVCVRAATISFGCIQCNDLKQKNAHVHSYMKLFYAHLTIQNWLCAPLSVCLFCFLFGDCCRFNCFCTNVTDSRCTCIEVSDFCFQSSKCIAKYAVCALLTHNLKKTNNNNNRLFQYVIILYLFQSIAQCLVFRYIFTLLPTKTEWKKIQLTVKNQSTWKWEIYNEHFIAHTIYWSY